MKAVTCDECGKRFGVSLKADTLEEGGELWWFRCLHCGHRYETARITAKGLEIRQQLEAAKKQKANTVQLRIQQQAEVQRLSEAMRAEVSKP